MKQTLKVSSTRAALFSAAALTLAATGFSQQTNEIQTNRRGPTADFNNVKASGIPRYYLDTIDTLERETSDLTRPAPGLAKNNYIGKVYEIYNAEAIEIQSYLLRTLAYEGGIAEVMGANDVKDASGRVVQYLFVTMPDFMEPYITEIVEKTDRPGFRFFDATGKDFGGGPGAVAYVGKHRTASELTAILGATELGNVGVFLFPPFADDSTNTIYIVENPTDIADDIIALELFDKPPLQVELEVTIYETEVGDNGALGLDWGSFRRAVTGTFGYSATGSTTGLFDKEIATYDTILTFDARIAAELLNYTVQTGDSKVLTKTRITMVNSEDVPGGLAGGLRGTATGDKAVISSTRAIPYSVWQPDIGATNSLNEFNEVVDDAFEGVKVELLSFIGTESMTLDIDVVVNSLVGFSKEADIPIIASRDLSTVANIRNGETLVIGGLDKQNSVESRTGIPILKDIPIINPLFSETVFDTTTTKVTIVIKPTLKTSDSAPFDPAPEAGSDFPM